MHWTGNVDSVAFTIFGKDIAWYGIIITSAMIIGLLVGTKRLKRIGLTMDDMLEVFMIVIPLAIIFARLGYVLVRPNEYIFIENFNWQDFVNIFAIWDGGLTIMTGVPGGILGGLIWCKWRKVDFLTICDVAMPVVLLSQGLGRWGNFCNQEIYGAQITKAGWCFFPFAVYIAAEQGFFQATFFYEMVLDITAFGILIFISDRLKLRGSGIPLYGIAYPLIRFVMEFFRDDGSLYEKVNFNQIICLITVIVSAVVLVLLIVKAKKKGQIIWYKSKVPAELYPQMQTVNSLNKNKKK